MQKSEECSVMCYMQNQTLSQSRHSRDADRQAGRGACFLFFNIEFDRSSQQAGGRTNVACKRSIIWFLLQCILNSLFIKTKKEAKLKAVDVKDIVILKWLSLLWLSIQELKLNESNTWQTQRAGELRMGWLAASRRWSIDATSARSSLPDLLCAELGYNMRFHCGYLDPTTQTTSNTNTTTTTNQARLLSLCSRGQGLRLGRDPGFQRGQ